MRIILVGSNHFDNDSRVEQALRVVQQTVAEEVILVTPNLKNHVEKVAKSIAKRFGWVIEDCETTESSKRGIEYYRTIAKAGAKTCILFQADNSTDVNKMLEAAQEEKLPVTLFE